jgi:hypothetical protein
MIAALLGSFIVGVVATATQADVSDRLVVTRETAGYLAPECSIRGVAASVQAFFSAFNQGSSRQVSRFIAPAASFKWYSVTEATKPPRNFVTHSRSQFLRYVIRRHRRHERLRLIIIDAGPSSRQSSAAMHFVVRRNADDLAPGLGGSLRIAEGKAEINCQTRRIYVWSMGMDMAPGLETPPHVSWSCPQPAGWSAGGETAIACTRI